MPLKPEKSDNAVNRHNDISYTSTKTDTKCILEFQNLTVQRGDFPLCEKVNLSLHVGDICHLIGANGTGKTTLMMQLVGLLPLIEGKVFYHGLEQMPDAPLYVSHQLGIHPNLTVSQNLTFLLNLYGIQPSKTEINEALDWVGLSGLEHMNSNQLSAGQTRRVTLARLYLMTPQHTPLWLLDEPFTALDVGMVGMLSERLKQFSDAGGAILMTSHQPVDIATTQLNLSDFIPEYLSSDEFSGDDFLEDSYVDDGMRHNLDGCSLNISRTKNLDSKSLDTNSLSSESNRSESSNSVRLNKVEK